MPTAPVAPTMAMFGAFIVPGKIHAGRAPLQWQGMN